jgi:trehalose synthase
MLDLYAGVSPKGDLQLLKLLGEKLGRRSMLHVNSTRAGGGVAEILQRMVPILGDLGITARWEVIEADGRFFDITKKIHNSLQGQPENITKEMWDDYFEVNRRNAGRLDSGADIVFIHDPQPAPLVQFRKAGRWIWRCHIDLSNPFRETASHLRRYWEKFDAAIFSVAKFALTMGLDEYIIPPSIDPISDKNRDLTPAEIDETLSKFRIPRDRPVILQVSRFDRFKDPVGVVKAYRMVKKYNDCILVLAGSPATDDPEGEAVLNEVREFAGNDPDIHLLLLPPFSDRDINALQRGATVILQKSLKEGFGLTVAEAMWKEKPVIGGAVGGIQLQIIHGVTGFLGYSYEGAAFRIRQLINNPEMAERMGKTAREHVRNNFLITRQIRDYLAVCYALENRGRQLVELA